MPVLYKPFFINAGYRSFRILGGSMGYHIRLYDQRMGYLSDWSGCKFYFFNQAVG